MQETLTPLDEKALAAKADRLASGELFAEVKGLLVNRLASWRTQYDQDELESFIGEIYVGAIRGFEVGRAPFLAFLLFHANRYMIDQFRTSKRPKHEFAQGALSLDRPLRRDGNEAHPTMLKDVIESREPAADASMEADELRDDLAATIESYTDRPEVWDFLKRVTFEGVGIAVAAKAVGFGRVWGQNTLVGFMEFARTHSRMQTYREDA